MPDATPPAPSNQQSPKTSAPDTVHAPMPEWMKITMASAGGMATSFAGFLAFTLMQSSTALRGELMAGDPAVNSQYPSTYNAFQASLTGENPIMNAMTSYMWWTGVIIGGALLSWFFLGFLRNKFG
jgi:hypothetical protein